MFLFLLLKYFWNFVCLLYCTVVLMHAVLLSLLIFIPDSLCCSFIFIKMPLFPFLIWFFLVSDPYYWLLLMQPVLFILHFLSLPCVGILCHCVYSSTITASPPLKRILKRFQQQVQRVCLNLLFFFQLIEDKNLFSFFYCSHFFSFLGTANASRYHFQPNHCTHWDV